MRKATALFRRLTELVTPGQREELRKEYKDEGILNFDEQTAQVRLRPSALSFTDSHSIETSSEASANW